MTTSNNTIFEVSRDTIINAALRKLGVLGEGVSANSTQLSVGAEALNLIVAEFQTFGMPLWSREEYLLVLNPGQQLYTFGIGQEINIPFPLHIQQALLEVPPYTTQIDIGLLSSYDFRLLPNGSRGTPVNLMYQPKINYGELSVWPTPGTSVPTGTHIKLIYQAPFQYFDSGTNTPYFPQEWGNALIYQLALNLSDEYTIPEQKKAFIEKQAEKHLSSALSFGTEDGSLFFSKDWQGN